MTNVTQSHGPSYAGRMKLLLLLPLVLTINPFTGAGLRNWQGCCLDFSLKVAAWLWPFLLLALGAFLLPWFRRHPVLKYLLGWTGIAGWCIGGPISCLHALC